MPAAAPLSPVSSTSQPLMCTYTPTDASYVLLKSSMSATAAILARASPLNPSVATEFKSSPDFILLVACLSNAITASSASKPQPLSVILIYFTPPELMSTVIVVAPASIEFSASSFTTEAGLSITSPAAI